MKRRSVTSRPRCRWATADPLLERYHDSEWGKPVRGDRAHFERLSLEVFQAGLSWRLILKKRREFRKAFHDFEPEKVARLTGRDVARLLDNPGIVRNRLKVQATIHNAKRFLSLAERHDGFTRYLNSVGDDAPALKAALRSEFKFMGPLVAEAYLQSVGRLPTPHDKGCFMRSRGSGR